MILCLALQLTFVEEVSVLSHVQQSHQEPLQEECIVEDQVNQSRQMRVQDANERGRRYCDESYVEQQGKDGPVSLIADCGQQQVFQPGRVERKLPSDSCHITLCG